MARRAPGLAVGPLAPLSAAALASTLSTLLATLAAAPPQVYSTIMSSERAEQAMERIERAIGRIEAVIAQRPMAKGDGDIERLRETHRALRGQVEGAIAQIDRILADGGEA